MLCLTIETLQLRRLGHLQHRCLWGVQLEPNYLKPQYPTENIKEGLSRRSEIQQQYYNRNAKETLCESESQDIKKWAPATVTRVTEAPRSYVVDAEGPKYKRNRRDLIKTTEATNRQPDVEDSKTDTTNPVHHSVSSEKGSRQGLSHPTTRLV